jgi:hypothetical protein
MREGSVCRFGYGSCFEMASQTKRNQWRSLLTVHKARRRLIRILDFQPARKIMIGRMDDRVNASEGRPTEGSAS